MRPKPQSARLFNAQRAITYDSSLSTQPRPFAVGPGLQKPTFTGHCRWELDLRRAHRNLGDLRCGVTFDDSALVAALLRLRTLIPQSATEIFDVLDEIERPMHQPISASARTAYDAPWADPALQTTATSAVPIASAPHSIRIHRLLN